MGKSELQMIADRREEIDELRRILYEFICLQGFSGEQQSSGLARLREELEKRMEPK